MDNFGFRIAIQDANAQAILKTFMVELHILMKDYDFDDTIPGEEITKLIAKWDEEMKKR